MIKNKEPEARKSTPNEKDDQYKKSKCAINYRKNVSGDQIKGKSHRYNQGSSFDINKPAGTDIGDLIGERVQVTIKNGARLQGTLSEASSLDDGSLEILLKNACVIRHGDKKNGLALATGTKSLTIKSSDLLLVLTPAKGTNGNNAFKADQKINGNVTRQHRQHSRRRRSTTSEVFCEESADPLDLDHVGAATSSFSNTHFWDQLGTNEKDPGLMSHFDRDLYTTKLDRSTCDQKANLLADEAQKSSRNNTCSLEETYGVPEYQTCDDEDRHSIANNYTSKGNKNCSYYAGHRPQKTSTKTHDAKKAHHQNQRNRQVYRTEPYGQNATYDSKSTTSSTHHNYRYSKMGTVPDANRKNSQWSVDNSKKVYRHDYQHKKWIRNDTDVDNNYYKNNTDTHRLKYSHKNNVEKNMNSVKSVTSNGNSIAAPPSTAPFKLNIMATEFIPLSSAHVLPHDFKPKLIPSSTSTGSSASSLSTPQTPPLRTQPVSLNELFPAPFNKPTFSAPSNTDPLWQCGRTSYRHHEDFTSLPNIYWQMNQYPNLHQLYYGYQRGDMVPYVSPSYLPYYHCHQSYQSKHNPRANSTMIYPNPGFKRYMKGAGNQQPYLGVLSYQNYY